MLRNLLYFRGNKFQLIKRKILSCSVVEKVSHWARVFAASFFWPHLLRRVRRRQGVERFLLLPSGENRQRGGYGYRQLSPSPSCALTLSGEGMPNLNLYSRQWAPGNLAQFLQSHSGETSFFEQPMRMSFLGWKSFFFFFWQTKKISPLCAKICIQC